MMAKIRKLLIIDIYYVVKNYRNFYQINYDILIARHYFYRTFINKLKHTEDSYLLLLN